MFNGELQTYIVADIISIIIMFLSSLLFHRIYGAYYYDEWSYKLVDIIMTFLVTILFGFLIGISSIFSDYIELYLKNQALTNNFGYYRLFGDQSNQDNCFYNFHLYCIISSCIQDNKPI